MPAAKLAVKVTVVPAAGVNVWEQVSPLGHRPMNMVPSLSTSRANWWVVSVLVRVMETVSPWVTVIFGLGLVVEAFQAVNVPTSTIVRVAAWTRGTGESKCCVGGNRKTVSPRRNRTIATGNARLERSMINLLPGSHVNKL